MFKFFRKYNKVILVVGGCVLMVAFLVPQAVTMFAPKPGDVQIGTVHGEEVTQGDLRNANFELQLLTGLFGWAMPTGEDGQPLDDGLAWLFMLRDAEQLGLWASTGEVNSALELVGLTDEDLETFAADRGLNPDGVRASVRRWLIAEQYRQLVDGIAFSDSGQSSPSPALRRLEAIAQVQQMAAQFGDQPQMQQYVAFMLANALGEAAGGFRMSEAALGHFVHDNFASIGGSVLLIPADVEGQPEPSEQALQDLFEQYRDQQPGEGEPFPFGYLVPDQVRVEYLQVPIDAIRSQKKIGNAELLEFYQDNKQQFAGEDGTAPDLPTPEARRMIENQLTEQAVAERFQAVLSGIQSLLADDVRGIDQTREGFYELPDGYEPTPLAEIAEAIDEEYGVQPNVLSQAERWVTADELDQLEGIGEARVLGTRGMPFSDYVLLARGLSGYNQEVPRSLRIQAGVGGKPLMDSSFNGYVFRLREVSAAHPPADLAEVRDRVERDARRVAAFEALKTQAGELHAKVQQADDPAAAMQQIADDRDGLVQETGPFERITAGGNEPPVVPGVGSSRRFVDETFALVEDVEPTADVAEMNRSAAVPLESTAADEPGLAIFLLETYEPLTRSAFRNSSGRAGLNLSYQLNGERAIMSFDRETLAERVGFDLEAYDEEYGSQDDEPTEEASDSAES